MTRNVEMRRSTFAKNSEKSTAEYICKNTVSTLKNLYMKAQRAKKAISSAVVEASEILADRTARKGLFGEDSDCPCCSTNVDYIGENALELKYINLDMTGFDNAYISRGNTNIKNARNTKDSGVLKCFNGF